MELITKIQTIIGANNNNVVNQVKNIMAAFMGLENPNVKTVRLRYEGAPENYAVMQRALAAFC